MKTFQHFFLSTSMVICFVHSDSLLALQLNLKKHASIGLWNLKTHTLRNERFNKNIDKRKNLIIFSELQQKEKCKSQGYGSEMLKWCGQKRSKSARNWVTSLKWNLWPWQNLIIFSQQTETYIFLAAWSLTLNWQLLLFV